MTGQKTSFDVVESICYNRRLGKTVQELADMFSVTRQTVYNILNREKNGDRLESKHSNKRPHKMTERAKRILRREVDENSKVSTRALAIKLKEECGIVVCHETVRRVLKRSVADETLTKCRCCLYPSTSFIELESSIFVEGRVKKYKDILFETTKLTLSAYQENYMPQKICRKCEIQLINSYKFIQQICKISEQFLQIAEQNNDEDITNFEHLQETLVDISETQAAEESCEELEIEPLSIEYNNEINEEKNDSSEESTEESNLTKSLKTDIFFEDDDDESDEPESLDNLDIDIFQEPIARCCDICRNVYRDEHALKRHKHYAHMAEEDKKSCPLCDYKSSRTWSLKVHIGSMHGHDKVSEYFKTDESNSKYPCNLCKNSYDNKSSLRSHISRKHQTKCEKETGKKKLSKPKDRFLCTYCGKSYSLRSSLNIHILSHTGERPFSCEICNKKYKRLTELQLHRVMHNDEKPHQCSKCGKAFKRMDQLKFHMHVHSKLRYKCNECDKAFKYSSVLKNHMYIHTAQKPFVCKTCGEAFPLSRSLNEHRLKHGHFKSAIETKGEF